ncbi:non-ribosomal peptide synthetase [Actinokineospora globicatena]|uniref:Carrier domain-containing protein n=1 Tax=Actinokineospora globicatena TaxID=103729 RepID=A0A9W6QKV0_9PSEU|nr:non-ribosomal peptide synthetase [Actinokineospora globicatena]GLW90339.1 hypothetical protein Aglo03_11550 [Actinokineospora globicatena]
MSAADDEAARLKQELLSRLLAKRAGGGAAAVRRVGADEDVAASFAQRRLWFLDELAGGAATYNVPFGFRVVGDLSFEAVEHAWREVFTRHEALRTRFVRTTGGELVQRPRPAEDLPVDLVDLADTGQTAAQRVAEFGARPFVLATDPLVRVEVVRTAPGEHLMLVNIHHIVSDGWSERFAFAEFAELYAARVQGRAAELPEVPYQYRDYTAWEYGVAASGGFDRDVDFWAEQVAGAPPLLELPHDKPYPRRASGEGRTVSFSVDAEITEAVDALKTACGTTAFAVVMSAFAVLLHRITGVGDLVLGVPVANRGRPEWDRTCGLFVNTVVVRIGVRGEQSAPEVVRAVRDRLLSAQQHENVPFDKVATRVAPGRDAAFTPVFQVMCNADEAPHALPLPGLTATPLEVPSATSKFDLTLHAREDGSGRFVGCAVEYRADLFDAAEVDTLVEHFRTVLRAFADSPDQPVSRLRLTADTHDGEPLLDQYLHPVAPGAVGEFHRRGEGTTPHPTGVHGRRRVDGTTVVLGRADRVVVVDGIPARPELTEAALRALPEVTDAAVVPAGGGRPGLIGFFAAPDGTDPAPLLAALSRTLVRHQVPARLIRLAALPRTPRGAVDLESLSTAAERDAADAADTGAGWTPTERRMADLWSEVLGRTGLRRDDDFFTAGGHSMLATLLIARIRREWGLEVPLRGVFEEPELGSLSALVDRLVAGGARGRGAAVIPRRPDGPIPLAPNQEHLLFLDQLSDEDGQYNLTQSLELEGELDEPALRAAIAAVVDRHESLRTRFRRVDGSPVQVVVERAELDHAVVDLTGDPDRAESVAEEHARVPFDLARGPLLRTRVYRLAPDRHLFVLIVHHLVFDGWSGAVFQREVAEFYRAELTGTPAQLPALAIQYPDYAVWQRDRHRGAAGAARLEHWVRHLADAPTQLDLPTDHPRPPVRTAAAEMVRALVPKDLLDRVAEVGAARGCTPYMTLLSAFAVLVHRFSGHPDVLVGTTVTSRGQVELEGQIGYFVNTTAVRSRLTADTGFQDVLAAVRREVLDGHPHREVPFAEVVRRVAPERSTGHSPLAQVLFDMHAESERGAELTGLRVRPVRLRAAAVDFDLVLAARITAEGLHLELEFGTDLFTGATAQRLLGHFHTLLASIARTPDAPAARLPIMTADERAAVLATASGRHREVEPVTAHELFRRQAERTPDAVGLTHRGVQLTYARLDADANALAHRLVERGVGPDTRVGLLMDRGPRLFTALLAVLKAGGAYVPLDMSYPGDRLRFMCAEAGVRLVLTDADARAVAAEVGEVGEDVLEIPPGPIATGPVRPPRVDVRPDHLAYVLYTSGSTGRPKGVAMSHRALANLARWDRDEIPVRPTGAVLQFNSLGFDASFVEMFAAWQVGARLVVLPDDAARRDPAVVLEHLETGGVERWDVPYAGLVNVVSWTRALDRAPLLRLRAVMCGGEQLQVTDDLADWFAALPGCGLVNQYGPSEVSRATSHWLPTSPGRWPVLPPIGRPADNTAVHVLDPTGEPVPPGFPGEVWISGENLARGYVNRPDLTADRFVPDVVGAVPGARLYRTGDLARYDAAGRLEFLGRVDTQVKLRGHRVELGEVEAALQRLPAVSAAAVAVAGTGVAKGLVAYLVLAEGAALPKQAEMTRELARHLPDYMVPVRFTVLDRLPLTASGKLDRRGLPEVDGAELSTQDFVAPDGEREVRVSAMWARLLGRESVGATDNFFALGGHSLLATEFVAWLHDEAGVSARVSALFENPTVRRFCAAVAWTGPEPDEPRVRKLPRRGRARTGG